MKISWWRFIVIGLLASTATIKLISMLHPAQLLYQEDGVLGLPIKDVMAIAAYIEVSICLLLCVVRDDIKNAAFVLIFSITVLIYRSLEKSSGVYYCPCLGNAINWWPWLGAHEAPILTAIAYWLLATSLFILIVCYENSMQSASQMPTHAHTLWEKVYLRSHSLLNAYIPLSFALIPYIWMAPQHYSIFNSKENVEYSRILLLFHHSSEVFDIKNGGNWLYTKGVALIFNIIGFHFWIPRVITLITFTAVCACLKRFMPPYVGWIYLLCACFAFCSFPSVSYFIMSADPEPVGYGIAIVAVAILPNIKAEYTFWRFVMFGVLSAISTSISLLSLAVIQVGLIKLGVCIYKNDYIVKLPSGEAFGPLNGQRWARPIVAGAAILIGFLPACYSLTLFNQMSGWHNSAQSLKNMLSALGCESSSDLIWVAPGIVAASAWGVVTLILRRYFLQITMIIALFVSIFAFEIVFHPWWPYFVFSLSVPFAALAGFGIGDLITKAIRRPCLIQARSLRNTDTQNISMLIGGIILSLWMSFEVPRFFSDVSTLKVGYSSDRYILNCLNRYKGRVNWMYARNSGLAAEMGCCIPPELFDIPDEDKAVYALSGDYFLGVAKTYRCEVLILTSAEISDDRWRQFTQNNYTLVCRMGDKEIFVANVLKPLPMPMPGDVLKTLDI